MHDQNSSGASNTSIEHLVNAFRPLVLALQRFPSELPLNREEKRALNKRLGREYFWHLGYSVYWQNGRGPEALEMFGRGLAAWPWDPAAWKTYLLSRLKLAIGALRK
jgi:hypothetical protein